jgi:hypothetical protein
MYSTLVPCESILPDVVGIAFQQVIGMVRPPMTQRGLGPIFLYVLFLEAIHVQAPSPVCFEGIRRQSLPGRLDQTFNYDPAVLKEIHVPTEMACKRVVEH